MASSDIVIEVAVRAPIEQVWRAWITNASLEKWLTEKANVRAEVGGPYELFWEPKTPELASTLGCKVTAVEPQKRLAFEWRGPPPYADLMNVKPFPTRCVVDFANAPEGRTRVKLTHTGWGEGPRWTEARTWQQRAWQGAIDALAAMFEAPLPSPRGRGPG